MKRKNGLFFSIMLLSFLLSGCLYPEENLNQNEVPYEDQLQSVQSAVNQFQTEEGGILPIKTKEDDPDIYEKYPVDFSKISPRFMAEPPGNAYESGGIYQYVLIDVETNPSVKLIDLRIAEQIRSIRVRLLAHEFPPFKDALADNVYTLDFKELGYEDEPYITSPYSGKQLPLVMSGDGTIYIDYAADLYAALQETDPPPAPGEDIRSLLTQSSPFVPAYSLPYTVDEQGEPIFMNK
ncbi:hypothetical protein [Domibacillus enclensis]|uniref:ABC transporter periplasmic binding protein yphF n=1 Tax=Domibacillus enclensis TaxID=1017273 RepID=A0A1N6P9I0_9BACI|nr:hypothetical protein [Domibacillus enclensis]OXS80284.1 hypothetical protein B1B05_02075 [Domibacillus enclensis]SIQ00916.1 hypothetical protein SAMN05443094_101433 [Domibacillus enclensis]